MVNFNNFSSCTFDLTDASVFSVGIDWLSFTFKMSDDDFQSEKFLTQEIAFRYYCPELNFIFKDAFEFQKNSSHYKFAFGFHENCAYFFDGFNVSKGFNVSIPGHALEWFYNTADMSVLDMFQYFDNHHITVSRLDICVDDYSKKYRPKYYADLMNSSLMKTRIKFWSFMGSNRSCGGTTFALGKRNTQKYLRIYDKDIESKGKIDAVRYEFELHRDTAQKFICRMSHNSLSDCVYSLFTDFFRVLCKPIESFAGQHYKDDIFDDEFDLWLKSQVKRIVNIIFQCNNYTKEERAYSQFSQYNNWLRGLALMNSAGYISIEEIVLAITTWSFTPRDVIRIQKFMKPECKEFVNCPFDVFEQTFIQTEIKDFINV